MKVAAAAVLLVLALAAAGCGSSPKQAANTQSTQSQPPAATATTAPAATTSAGPATAAAPGCKPVSGHLVSRIEHNIVLDGAKLSNFTAVAASGSPGVWWVSARVQGGGAPKHAVATWATDSLAGTKPIYALDSFAALISKFGGGVSVNPDFTVGAPGVHRSRLCAGGTRAPHTGTAPPSGPIIKSPN